MNSLCIQACEHSTTAMRLREYFVEELFNQNTSQRRYFQHLSLRPSSALMHARTTPLFGAQVNLSTNYASMTVTTAYLHV